MHLWPLWLKLSCCPLLRVHVHVRRRSSTLQTQPQPLSCSYAEVCICNSHCRLKLHPRSDQSRWWDVYEGNVACCAGVKDVCKVQINDDLVHVYKYVSAPSNRFLLLLLMALDGVPQDVDCSAVTA